MTMTRNAIGLVLAGAIAVGQFGVLQAQTPSQSLGSVRLGRAVMADGKALPAGTYSLRRSADPVTPVVGQGADHATWVEFVQGGQVKGRELASVVPSAEAKTVIKGTAPGANTSRVDLLKGGEYLRIWSNRGGNHYLIHLLVGS